MLRRHRIHRVLPLLVFLLISVAATGDALAQVGAIKGVVRDKESGEQLDYANVLLAGSTRGTMSLGGGVFYFNGLPAGSYTVKVLYLGYAPMEKTVTVTAGGIDERHLRSRDGHRRDAAGFRRRPARNTWSRSRARSPEHTVSGETFEKYAIDSVEDALSKQAGVVYRAGELYVRGGRSGEVSMQIDGVAVDNPLGTGSMEVSSLAVDNMAMVTGGLDAKYGNALSGVVNITTKEGGEKFGGGVRFLTDDFGRQDKTYTNYDRLEYGFGGPTPLKGVTYYLAGDLQFSDTENTSVAHRPEYKLNLGDTTLFKFRRRQFNQAKGSAKIGLDPEREQEGHRGVLVHHHTGRRLRAQLERRGLRAPGALHAGSPAMRPASAAWLATGRTIPVYYGPWYETMLSTARTVMVIDTRNSSERRVAHAGARGARRHRQPRSTRSWPRPSSTGSATRTARSRPWPRTVRTPNSTRRTNLTQNRSIGQVAKVVWRQNLDESTFYVVRLGLVAFDSRVDVQGKDPWEYNHGGIWSPGLFLGQSRIYLGGTAYYSDPLSPYFVTNSDVAFYSEEYSRTYSLGTDMTSSRWEGHLVELGLGVRYNDLERYALTGPAIMRQSRFTSLWSQGSNRNVFHTYNPEAYWYLQDRWEYEGMVVNYGLRYDMFSPGSAAAIELANEGVNANVIKYKTAFQPRLGFAFPITERDGFHFHYGRFVQFPDRQYLFASQDPVGNAGTLGNPNLEPMTTVQYSSGIKHQFSDFIAGQFSLYSKDMYDLIAATQVTDEGTGQTLARYINKAYASSRGIELSLEKRYSENYEFDMSYTYMFADGVASDSEFGSNPDGLQFLPNQELPLDWDQRHTLNVRFLLADPGVWSSSFSFSYGSGVPWTPFDRFAKKQDPLLENSERLPATYSLDIQLERNVNVYGKRLSLQLQAFNLLDQDVVVAEGGAGIAPGMINGAQSLGIGHLTETGKYGAALLQDANGDGVDEYIPIVDPRTFGDHRLFRLAIGYYF